MQCMCLLLLLIEYNWCYRRHWLLKYAGSKLISCRSSQVEYRFACKRYDKSINPQFIKTILFVIFDNTVFYLGKIENSDYKLSHLSFRENQASFISVISNPFLVIFSLSILVSIVIYYFSLEKIRMLFCFSRFFVYGLIERFLG